MSSHPMPHRLADLLFGTDPRLRVRVRLSFLASCIYTIWAAVMLAGLRGDMVSSPGLGLLAVSMYMFAAVAFYPLVRSGKTASMGDPALVLPQMVMAFITWSVGYLTLPDARGPILQVMCLVQVFGLLSLTPREVSVAGASAVMSLAGAWALGSVFLGAAAFDPMLEAVNVGMAGFILTLITVISHSYSRVRRQVRSQKQTLTDAVARVEHVVSHDTLTGLFNRHHMVQALERELSRADRSGQGFAVVIVDLDHFKQINDTYGHHVGDEVLESFAAIMLEVLRETDIVGRWGGEEFLLLLPDTKPAQRAKVGLHRLRTTLKDTIVSTSWPHLRVAFSAGIAVPVKGETADSVLERADRALYTAKEEGRDCAVVAD